MPFAPLHMGPGLGAKASVPRRFSITVFGLTQVAIDLEVLWHMLRADRPLHRFWHSYAGALLVAGVLTLVGKPLSQWIKRAWNLLAARGRLAGWRVGEHTSWEAALSGALVGAVSPVFLDSLYHANIEPFGPWCPATPFSTIVTSRQLDFLCIALGIAGLAWLLARGLKHRQTG